MTDLQGISLAPVTSANRPESREVQRKGSGWSGRCAGTGERERPDNAAERRAEGLTAPAQSIKLSFGSFDANSCIVRVRLGLIGLSTLFARFRLRTVGRVCRGASRVPQLAFLGA